MNSAADALDKFLDYQRISWGRIIIAVGAVLMVANVAMWICLD